MKSFKQFLSFVVIVEIIHKTFTSGYRCVAFWWLDVEPKCRQITETQGFTMTLHIKLQKGGCLLKNPPDGELWKAD